MPKLAIVIVSWNVRDLLRRCLHTLDESLAGSGMPYITIVVDNASADGSPEMLRSAFPQVRLLEPGANLGFAGGNNHALRLLLAESDAPEYILLLNPDTEPQADAIPCLLRALQSRPHLAAIGPQLRYPDGSLQSSRRRFPTRATFFWESTPLDRAWPANPWAQHYRLDDRSPAVAQPADWLMGAALLLRTEAIRRAGLLDERFFMYSEELEWQRRIQNAWSDPVQPTAIGYLPAAVVVHHEGKSSERAPADRHSNFQRSRILLARMWYGWRFAAWVRQFYRACYAYELALEALKLILGHRPALRRERIAIYRRVIENL
ncbi:MAG: glycosyltransferase family 2 protein [Oscillochloris sp.]|nr:glycosyltransferase family 2 protein [Oscillochloris sp.]